MKTVVLIENERTEGGTNLYEIFQKYEALFADCEPLHGIYMCPWYANVGTIEEAAPDLSQIVGTDSEWRAIVLTDLSFGCGKNLGKVLVTNPFDLYDLVPLQVDNDDHSREEESERSAKEYSLCEECIAHPLPAVALSRMLGGIPKWRRGESVLRGWKMRDEECSSSRMVMERLPIPFARPRELIFVSPRNVQMDILVEDENAYSTYDSDVGISYDFQIKSGFSDLARFVVVDRPTPPSNTREHDELSLLLSCFTLACYDNSRSSLAYGRLYRFSIDFDEDEIWDIVAKDRAQHIIAAHAIEDRLEEIEGARIPDESLKQNIPSYAVNISMPFDLIQTDDLFIDKSRFGLCKNTPVMDEKEFIAQKKRIFSELAEILRAPRRALRLALSQFHACDLEEKKAVPMRRLNMYAQDILEEELKNAEEELASVIVPFSSDFEEAKKPAYSAEKTVNKHMSNRICSGPAAMSLGLGASIIFVTFLPYILGLDGSFSAAVPALVVTLWTIAIVCLIGFAFLTFSRYKFGRTLSMFNLVMIDIFNELQFSVAATGRRISLYATLIRGWSILDSSRRKTKFYSDEEEMLLHNHARILRHLEKTRVSKRTDERVKRIVDSSFGVTWPEVRRSIESGSLYKPNVVSADAKCDFNAHLYPFSQTKTPFSFVEAIRIDPINPVILGGEE